MIMKKVIAFLTVVILLSVSVKTNAQLYADNISVEVQSTLYPTCTVSIAATNVLGQTSVLPTPFVISTNTVVNLPDGLLFYITQPTPPIPAFYVRIEMVATAGSSEAYGAGDWTTPNSNTWHFDGGFVKANLDN